MSNPITVISASPERFKYN